MAKTIAKAGAPALASRRRYWNNERKETLAAWLFLAPEVVGLVLLSVFPILFSLYLSFCDWNLVGGLSAIKWVGLDNYRALFDDNKIMMALKNNLTYTACVVPVGIFLALLLSVTVHSKVYGKEYFKIAFFIPYISSIVALGAVWSALFHPSQGPINRFLIGLGFENPPKWLADTHYSLTAIMVIAIWAALGYQIVIFIAGLSGIPQELYEAADIDGANQVQQFTRITLPLLGPTLSFLIITSLMGSFKVFDLIAFLTDGGPNESSTVLVYRIYDEGFHNFRMGYAAAISWVLFLIVGAVTLLTWKIQRAKVEP